MALAERRIEMRFCTEDDWQYWRDVRIAALTEAPYAYGSTLADWEGAAAERWRGRLRSVPFNAVATLDGAPAGLASGVPEEDGSVTLISMWVAPFARGCGIGDRLVRSVVEWARGRGAMVVRLDVVSNNVPAIELYRRNGFVDVGESSHCEIAGVPQREMTYNFEPILDRPSLSSSATRYTPMESVSAYARAAVIAGLAGNVAISIYLAVTLPLFFHTKPMLLFQWDASNIVGNSAYSGGLGSAALGFFFDCVVSICWAAIFAAVYQTFAPVRRMAALSGLLFGLVVMAVMLELVVPLGHAQRASHAAPALINTALAHTVFFGLPVALVIAALLRRTVGSLPGELSP